MSEYFIQTIKYLIINVVNNNWLEIVEHFSSVQWISSAVVTYIE